MSSAMIALISLHEGTKKPALANWNQRENCIIEFESYHRLQGFDLALADAFCEPPVGCLDIDNYELAHPILMSLGFDSEVADKTTFTYGRPQIAASILRRSQSLLRRFR